MIRKKIALRDIAVKAPVGVYEWEKKRQNDFLVSVVIETEFTEMNNSDDLHQTFDYEKINEVVAVEMSVSCNLLEDAAIRILNKIKLLDQRIENISVKIQKLNPPLSGDVKLAEVELNWNSK